MTSLLLVHSYHHNNTRKVAEAIASVLEAAIRTPEENTPESLEEADLIGFGSGIYGEKHHALLLDLVDRLPQVDSKNAFIFSTSAIMGKAKAARDHAALRDKLMAKGYIIVGEFSCRGFNTNSFMKYLGGMNRGRPNADDLKHAEEFARTLP